MKIVSISKKEKYCGLKIPFRATSIIPPENNAPNKTPTAATASITLNFATFAPTAEFKKFTASFETPTVKSITANKKSKTIIIK